MRLLGQSLLGGCCALCASDGFVLLGLTQLLGVVELGHLDAAFGDVYCLDHHDGDAVNVVLGELLGLHIRLYLYSLIYQLKFIHPHHRVAFPCAFA